MKTFDGKTAVITGGAAAEDLVAGEIRAVVIVADGIGAHKGNPAVA